MKSFVNSLVDSQTYINGQKKQLGKTVGKSSISKTPLLKKTEMKISNLDVSYLNYQNVLFSSPMDGVNSAPPVVCCDGSPSNRTVNDFSDHIIQRNYANML